VYFKRIYDQNLAQASYMVGCQRQGTAVVVDPRRDIGVYLELARAEGLRIVAVTETHIHADYLSGALELAQATGATLYLSDEGGEEWAYAVAHQPLRHGSRIELGAVWLEALHTPGHTPEHLSFAVIDGARADSAVMLLSGDFVFVGDLGRPDLLDLLDPLNRAAGGVDTRFWGAKQLFCSLRDSFLKLPDHVQVWPGHGSGSACGKALGAVESSTVGYERRFAWWSDFLERGDEAGFSRTLLEGQPDAPRYFGRMKRQNRAGPSPVPTHALERLEPGALDGKLLLDTRPKEAYQAGGLTGSLSLAANRTFETYAGWLLDTEHETRPLVLFARDPLEAQSLRERLWRVGIDRVVGFIDTLEGLPLERFEPLGVRPLTDLEPDAFVLDVRTRAEYEAGHFPGAVQIHAGQLYTQLERIPRERRVLVHCQSGVRSVGAASLLRAHGFTDVLELEGGYPSWVRAQEEWTRSRPLFRL